MLRLTSQGVAPAEAAAWALSANRTVATPQNRDGGGQAIPLGHATPAARGLARAAMRLDAAVMRTILEDQVAERGVIAAWDDVAVPVLVGIGERYQATKRFVEVEHLISRTVSEVLGAVPRPASSPRVQIG